MPEPIAGLVYRADGTLLSKHRDMRAARSRVAQLVAERRGRGDTDATFEDYRVAMDHEDGRALGQ